MTRAAYDGARISLNPFAINSSTAWSRSEPQFLGSRTFLSVTDTSSAARYGLQTARLSRAGDNGPDRTFVGPTPEGLRAGLESMKARDVPGVREPAVLEQQIDSYPLASLTYAAIAPLSLDEAARADYAEFVRYAATEGQQPGFQLGDLPPGYLPLPKDLADQAIETAESIVSLEPVPAPPPTPPSSTPAAPTTSPPQGPAPTSTEVAPLVVPPAGTTTRTPSRSTGSSSQTSADPSPTPVEEEALPSPITTSPPPTTVQDSAASPTASAVATPSTGTGPARLAVPVVSGMALLSALAALELSKRPRRPLDAESATARSQSR